MPSSRSNKAHYSRRGDEHETRAYDAWRPSNTSREPPIQAPKHPRDRSRTDDVRSPRQERPPGNTSFRPDGVEGQEKSPGREFQFLHAERQQPCRVLATELTASLPATNQNLNYTPLPNNIPANTREKVADILKEWQHWAVEKAKWERELNLKKIALGEKITEYGKSTGQQPEHPSVPEYQAKFRKRYEKDLATAEKHLAAASAHFDRCASNLAVSLTQRMPLEIENLIQQLMDKHIEKQTAALKSQSANTTSISDTELDRRIEEKMTAAMQSEIGPLCSRVDKLVSRVVELEDKPYSPEPAADPGLQAKMAGFQGQQEHASEALKQETIERQKELGRQQELIDKLTLRTKALEDQIAKLQAEKGATHAQAKQEPPLQAQPMEAVDADLASKVDKLEATQARDREYHVEQNKSLNMELASVRDQVQQGKALNKELAAIRLDTDRLKYRVDNLSRDNVPREEVSSLNSKLNNLELKTDELAAWQSQAKSDLAYMKPELEGCSGTIKNHKAKLARVDVDALERIADAFEMEVPTMQTNIAELQRQVSKIDQAGKEAQRGLTEVKQLMKEYSAADSATERATFTQTAQTLSPAPSSTGEVSPLQLRLSQLEDKVVHQGKLFGAFVPRLRAIKDDLAQEKQRVDDRFQQLAESTTAPALPISAAEVDALKVKVERLQMHILTLDQTVQNVGNLSNQVDYLSHQIRALDSQYQQLSTKRLMEAVVQHMHQVYPGTQKTEADVALLNDRLNACQGRVARVEQHVHGLLQSAPQSVPQHPLQNALHNSPLRASQNAPDLAAGNKRRRTDEPFNYNSQSSPVPGAIRRP